MMRMTVAGRVMSLKRCRRKRMIWSEGRCVWQNIGGASQGAIRLVFSAAYAEMDASSVRIVTQDDVSAACAADFEPLLKPYQLVGVNFLLLLYKTKISGAILADEMGLGKTIQAITYLTLLNYLENDPGPHLVVCPASVLANWERELKRWCPSFLVNSLAKAGMPPPYNVMLVCYSLFERRSAQQKYDRKVLKHWRWSCVLMDEAHARKDKNSYRWKNLMSVAKDSNQRLTPLQNDLPELWSLLESLCLISLLQRMRT